MEMSSTEGSMGSEMPRNGEITNAAQGSKESGMKSFFTILATALIAVSVTGLAEAGPRPGSGRAKTYARTFKSGGSNKAFYSLGKFAPARFKNNNSYRTGYDGTGPSYRAADRSGQSTMPYQSSGNGCCYLPNSYKGWSKCCWVASYGTQAAYCPENGCWYYYHPDFDCNLPWSCINDYPPPYEDGPEDDGGQSSLSSDDDGSGCDDGLAGDQVSSDDGCSEDVIIISSDDDESIIIGSEDNGSIDDGSEAQPPLDDK
jgi:hypothetical protein